MQFFKGKNQNLVICIRMGGIWGLANKTRKIITDLVLQDLSIGAGQVAPLLRAHTVLLGT